MSNDFEISTIIQGQEGEYANILPTQGQRPHNNSIQFMAECSTEVGLEEHNSDNVHLESLRNHLKNDVLVCHININSIQNKLESWKTLSKRSMHTSYLLAELKSTRVIRIVNFLFMAFGCIGMIEQMAVEE